MSQKRTLNNKERTNKKHIKHTHTNYNSNVDNNESETNGVT